MAENQTLAYYNRNAEEFVAGTVAVDFRETQEQFLRRLSPGAAVLDFGCGSGRDTKYFLERGMQVEAVDGSEALCKAASAYTGIPVRQMLFQELQEQEKYDGIWACASILHLPKPELQQVFGQMAAALRPAGIIYTSFKYGTWEGERNGRYFTDFTEETFGAFLEAFPQLQREALWLSEDVRPGRTAEKWLNVILRKR